MVTLYSNEHVHVTVGVWRSEEGMGLFTLPSLGTDVNGGS